MCIDISFFNIMDVRCDTVYGTRTVYQTGYHLPYLSDEVYDFGLQFT